MSKAKLIEQTTADADSNQPSAMADQNEVEGVKTEQVVNTKPAISRDSEEYKTMKTLRDKNRNNEVLAGIVVKYVDWDTDGNSEISDDECINGMVMVINSDPEQESTRNLLTIWDLDNDEKIERIELSNIVVLLDADEN